MVVSPVGLETKIHCAGEDQQQPPTGLDVFLDGLNKATKNLSAIYVRAEIRNEKPLNTSQNSSHLSQHAQCKVCVESTSGQNARVSGRMRFAARNF
jgi:hypothetical protein